jgi:hypothetical protein
MNMAKQPDSTAMPKPKSVEIILDEAESDILRPICGSKSDRFNNALMFPPGQSEEDRNRQLFVAVTPVAMGQLTFSKSGIFQVLSKIAFCGP